MKLFCLLYNVLQLAMLIAVITCSSAFGSRLFWIIPLCYVISFIVLLLLIRLKKYRVHSFTDILIFLMSTPVSALIYYGLFKMIK